MQVLTNSEKILLSSVAVFAVSLTAIVIFCLVRKSCWLHKIIWEDEKKKKQKMDDIICIRYPPDIYPHPIGVYTENAFRSPEEEMARLFYSPLKRDSTYSSMSDRSSNSSAGGFETSSPRNSSGSNTTTIGSPVTATVASTPEHSPGHSHPQLQQQQRNHSISSPMVPVPVVPVLGQRDPNRRLSMPHLSTTSGHGHTHHYHHHQQQQGLIPNSSNRTTASALAAEVANQRFSLHPSHPSARQQPFFTFILSEDNGFVHIEFIEARNLPGKEYVNQPSDAFFTLEIQPKKPVDRKKEMMRYRFVTKTIKKAGEICEFSETFIAQLAKVHLNDYMIKFSAYDQDRFGNPTEIGTTTLAFEDFKDFTTNKLVLSCSLKEPVLKRGDILIGMCYLPTAERMSVTIVKLNNLNAFFNDGKITKQSICYVRLLLLRADTGRVIRKKKTTFQKISGSNTPNQPVFNETIVFDMPPSELIHTVILALVCVTDKPPTSKHHRHNREEEENLADHAPEPQQQPQQSHNFLNRHHLLNFMNKASNESLFHFSDNLNAKAKRLDSSSSSRSSQGSGQSHKLTSIEDGGEIRRPSSSSASAIHEVEDSVAAAAAISASSPGGESNSSGTGCSLGSGDKPQRVKDTVVGKVALGYCIRNPLGVMNHWGEMMRYPRNVITEWHGLK